MNNRIKLAALATTVVIAAGGWAWTVGAAAPTGRGPSQPIGEGTVTYQRSEMVRPVATSEFPTASVSGLVWVSSEDLTFHPLVPCRVVDTRNIAAPLANEGVYSFEVIGTSFISQGGFAGDCGVPFRALAVELNVTAVYPSVSGFLKVYPYLATQPNASIVNYLNQNIANTATVARCASASGALCTHDVSVYAHTAVHLVVDVLGYYESPLSAQIDEDGFVFGASLGLDSVDKLSTGQYGVHFDRDVSLCVYSVTPGWGDVLSTAAAFVEAEDLSGDVNGVYVATRNSSGTYTDFPFQLVVHC